MAVHTYTTRTVIHHEWVLDAPVHHTDLAKAYHVASRKWEELGGDDNPRVGDIYATGRDEELIISFTEEPRGA